MSEDLNKKSVNELNEEALEKVSGGRFPTWKRIRCSNESCAALYNEKLKTCPCCGTPNPSL